jgi:hypothetical protein
MAGQDVNCLLEYKRPINVDGSYGPVNLYDILENVKRTINIFNNGSVFSVDNEFIKLVKIFEEMGYRLKKESLETLKLVHGSEYTFCDELDIGMPEAVGFLRRDINENQENSEFCITVNFDNKTIHMPLFHVMLKDDFKRNYRSKNDDWDYDLLDVTDFDPDNLAFNELEETIEFIRQHSFREFRFDRYDDKVFFMKYNMKSF